MPPDSSSSNLCADLALHLCPCPYSANALGLGAGVTSRLRQRTRARIAGADLWAGIRAGALQEAAAEGGMEHVQDSNAELPGSMQPVDWLVGYLASTGQGINTVVWRRAAAALAVHRFW